MGKRKGRGQSHHSHHSVPEPSRGVAGHGVFQGSVFIQEQLPCLSSSSLYAENVQWHSIRCVLITQQGPHTRPSRLVNLGQSLAGHFVIISNVPNLQLYELYTDIEFMVSLCIGISHSSHTNN